MNFQRFSALLLTVLLAFVAGCLASDYVTASGWPHNKYRVSFAFTPSSKSAWECSILSSVYGENLSRYSAERGEQSDCTLIVTGRRLPDGSLDIYLRATTWAARLATLDLPPRHVPASEIKDIAEVNR